MHHVRQYIINQSCSGRTLYNKTYHVRFEEVIDLLVISQCCPKANAWLKRGSELADITLPKAELQYEEALSVLGAEMPLDSEVSQSLDTTAVGLSLRFVMHLVILSLFTVFLSRCSLRSWSNALLRPETARRRLNE